MEKKVVAWLSMIVLVVLGMLVGQRVASASDLHPGEQAFCDAENYAIVINKQGPAVEVLFTNQSTGKYGYCVVPAYAEHACVPDQYPEGKYMVYNPTPLTVDLECN